MKTKLNNLASASVLQITKQNLIQLREQVMDRADRALDAAWPARLGDDYVSQMCWAASQLEAIASEMQAKGFGRVEQSRTYRYLGSVYSDLEPALGKEILLKARKAYQAAETLLLGQSDDLERAKLNFNFGNTLRQIDPNDIEQLHEAKLRLLAARTYFAANATQYLTQIDAALQSVESLLGIAPLANAVKQNTDEMTALQEALAAGGNVSEIAKKAQEIMKRGGGAAGMLGSLQAIIDALPDNQKRDEKFGEIQRQMQELSKTATGGKEMAPEDKQILSLLTERLKSEARAESVSPDRAETLSGVLEEFGGILSADDKDVSAQRAKSAKMKEFIDSKFEMTHYLSHGINRPPAGSRAAEEVELNWQLRRYLLEEMSRPEKGEEESKELLDLNMRASRVDKRIYEAGADNTRALTVEKEELRPLALTVRNFSARMYTMPARPIWRIANIPVDTNAVFYSGSAEVKTTVEAACRRSGLEILSAPRGEDYSKARWKQLQQAVTAIFDLRVADGTEMAAVTYELGIALTLGKPVLVLVSEDQTVPFDVDIEPIVLTAGPEDGALLGDAIDRSVVWTCPRPSADASLDTLEYVLSLYQRPHRNVTVDQTLRMLAEIRNTPDPLAMTRTLVKLFDYLGDGRTMLIRPRWSPVYPDENSRRLFHVMPFRPKWADAVTAVTRAESKAAGIAYIRGDEVDEPNVIRSIWEEIARATHVLVDLTGFNSNVALELGIAHTLGKNVLMVGQDDTIDYLFPSIRKLRVKEYSMKQLKSSLGAAINDFVTS
jgi:nucleoside 2-deoxyribosyltransferase